MPLLLGLLCLIPLLMGLILEYIVCRLTFRRGWKLLPPAAWLVLAAVVALVRRSIWRSEQGVLLLQLLLFPGVPAVFLLLGSYLGWRLWRRWWRPRVINDPGKK